jgi:hypothetical protein
MVITYWRRCFGAHDHILQPKKPAVKVWSYEEKLLTWKPWSNSFDIPHVTTIGRLLCVLQSYILALALWGGGVIRADFQLCPSQSWGPPTSRAWNGKAGLLSTKFTHLVPILIFDYGWCSCMKHASTRSDIGRIDVFVIAGPPGTGECQKNVTTMKNFYWQNWFVHWARQR